MKQIGIILIVFCSYLNSYCQIGIGTTNPHPSSILDVESTEKGFLLPRLRNNKIYSITNPSEGLMIYSTEENCLVFFNGTDWYNICDNALVPVPISNDNQIKLKASDTDNDDQFGYSISMNTDGTKVIVGAIREDSDATGVGNGVSNSGVAYIYSLSGGVWTQEAKLKADNAGDDDQFGYSVSMNADGTRVIVGAVNEDSDATGSGDGIDNSGAAYIYSFSGGVWTQETKLKSSDAGSTDQFGYAVSMNTDGTKIIVGSINEDSDATGIGNGVFNSGAVYLYSLSGGIWTQDFKLKANDADNDDQFGRLISMSSDGTKIIVGAIREDSDATGIGNGVFNSGAAYVYSLSGGIWIQEAKLKASDPGSSDNFGRSVSINADGTKAIVGSVNEDSDVTGVGNGVSDAGAAYVYSLSGGVWTQEAKLKADNADNDDQFGYSVSMNADGTKVVVGSVNEDSDVTGIGNGIFNSGAVYVYYSSEGDWIQDIKLKANNAGNGDNFGTSILMSSDGTKLIIGAINEDSDATGIGNGAFNSGAVYVY